MLRSSWPKASSGSEEAFAAEMNKKAKEIGLKNSVFRNATGLPDPEHVMTPRDLVTLAERTINDFPEYYHYYSEKNFTYNGIKQGNRNPLLYKDIGADGLKTGHTETAGYCLTASAKQGERRLILVITGLPSMKARSEEAERLLDYGFREFENVTLAKAGEQVDTATVWLGEEDTVPLEAPRDLTVTLPRRSRADLKIAVAYDGPVPAPIKKGDPIAKLNVSAPGMETLEVPLVAARRRAQAGLRRSGLRGAGIARRPHHSLSAGAFALAEAGRFIVFEGGEGTGKSTQARLLADALREAGIDVVVSREPGGAPGAEALRRLLLDDVPSSGWSPLSEALLHYAARNEHLEKTIKPALDRGSWVVCDRFADSTAAYQGAALGLSSEVLATLSRLVLGDFVADLTLVLDLPVRSGLARAAARSATSDRYERMDVDFHERVRQAFLTKAHAQSGALRSSSMPRPMSSRFARRCKTPYRRASASLCATDGEATRTAGAAAASDQQPSHRP